jgi:hypothetical protein
MHVPYIANDGKRYHLMVKTERRGEIYNAVGVNAVLRTFHIRPVVRVTANDQYGFYMHVTLPTRTTKKVLARIAHEIHALVPQHI